MNDAEKVQIIAEKQHTVYNAGYHKGLSDGRLNDDFEDGKQAEHDHFWNAYQSNGERTDYHYAFAGAGWNAENFKPSYNIRPTSSSYLFYNSRIEIDLASMLDELGLTMDLSKTNNLQSAFAYSKFTRVGVVDMTSTVVSSTSLFAQAQNLETVDKLVLRSDGSDKFISTFENAKALVNLTIEGVIGQNGLNLQWSPLSHDSLMSIINALQDKSADTSGTTWTVTIGTTNYAKLSAEEILLAENKGWWLV